MTVDQIPIWIDCDPGTDDAFAILLSIFHPKFKLLGISTVFGNTDIDQTTHNSLGLLDVLNTHDVPVYRGENTPLQKAPHYAHYAHGNTGMGDVKLPEHPSVLECVEKSYIEAIKDAILHHENEICILGIGAYTNLYKLFNKYPELKTKIRLLSLMGGAFDFGNVTPFAEFNIYADPKAANYILNDEILMDKIVMSPLNLTHTVTATKQIRHELFDKSSNPVRLMYRDILEFYNKLYERNNKELSGPPMHDPLAVFSILPLLEKNEIYHYKFIRRRVTVIETGEREGETIFVNGSKITESGDEEHGPVIGIKINGDLFFKYIAISLDAAEAKYIRTQKA